MGVISAIRERSKGNSLVTKAPSHANEPERGDGDGDSADDGHHERSGMKDEKFMFTEAVKQMASILIGEL